LTYQWFQCSASGGFCQTNTNRVYTTSYVVTPYDTGSVVVAQVTATNATGTTTVVSPFSAIVTMRVPDASPVNFNTVTLEGVPEVGGVLYANRGGWIKGESDQYGPWNTATAFAYQWQRCATTSIATCVNISGATANSYQLMALPGNDDRGSVYRATITATNGAGSTQVFTPMSQIITGSTQDPNATIVATTSTRSATTILSSPTTITSKTTTTKSTTVIPKLKRKKNRLAIYR
jgi:hypothetical protein